MSFIRFGFFLILIFVALVQTKVSPASNVVKIGAKNDALLDESKIVGGITTDITYISSQVAILLDDFGLLCSGNIIRDDVILTVAHALVNRNVLKLKIRSGSNYHDRHGRVVAAVGMTIHPDFRIFEGHNNFDIGLLFLASSATATGIPAAAITLWHAGAYFPPGTLARVAGWGSTVEFGPASDVLRSVVLPIVPADLCNIYGEHVPEYNICAGYLPGGMDVCHGDSGSGLVIDMRLAGLTAFGNGCGRENTPGGYTSIPVFRHWIWEHTHI